MCDYSLHNVASRAARLGDKLVVTDFAKTITRGFATVEEPDVAVCVLPGTELAFENHVQYHHALSRSGMARVNQKVARFRQINLDNPHVHHDALEFPGSEIVMVTHLIAGQRAIVLQLPARPLKEPETENRETCRLRWLRQHGRAVHGRPAPDAATNGGHLSDRRRFGAVGGLYFSAPPQIIRKRQMSK